jgi:preprotein translocase SecE subunit
MADEQPNKPTRRIVKNPETFRERAIKASETSDTPSRAGAAKQASGKAASRVFTPFRRLSGFLGKYRFFRVLGKVLLPAYFRNSYKELKLVTWPSWKQSRQLTYAVLVFAIVFGGVIALVDYGLDKVFRQVLLK